MKAFLLLVAITPMFLCAQWTSLNSGVTDDLWGIQFVDGSNGYCVGGNGLVLRTTDGGVTWASTTVGTDYISDLYFIDPSNGFIVTNDMVHRTTNGLDFEPLQLIQDGIPVNDSINYELFGSSFNFEGPIGIVSASYRDSPQTQPLITRNWKTLDFGETWVELYTIPRLSSFAFLDEDHWFAASFHLYESFDGGQTWDSSATNSFSFPPLNRDCFKITDETGRGLISMSYHLDFSYINSFDDPNLESTVLQNVIDIDLQGAYSRFLVYDNTGSMVSTSLDEGQTLLPDPEILPGARSIDFINEGQGWACGDGGAIWKFVSTETGVTHLTDPIPEFILFPNPAIETLSIQHFWNGFPERILVRDRAGKVVRNVRYTSTLDIHDLATGSYSITLIAGDKRGTVQFEKFDQ